MAPYSHLSESEKQYDRIMGEDTLKLFSALGYKIEKKDSRTNKFEERMQLLTM